MGTRHWIILGAIGVCFMCILFLSDFPIEEKLKHVYFLTSRGSSYLHNLKHPAHLVHSYFFPLHQIIAHQDNVEEANEEEDLKEKGKGEKVKKAVEKSLEKTKSTVEETAKSAAKIAGDTMTKTADKVKDTLTERTTLTDPQDEL